MLCFGPLRTDLDLILSPTMLESRVVLNTVTTNTNYPRAYSLRIDRDDRIPRFAYHYQVLS